MGVLYLLHVYAATAQTKDLQSNRLTHFIRCGNSGKTQKIASLAI